ATYMYEDDTPPAERRAQALSLDRDLLRELLGQEELRDLLDAGAVEDVEAQLRGSPRNADHLHDQLRLRGDLREGEYDEGFAQTLLRERRALLARFAGEQRLIAAEDAGRYREAVGVMPPGGLPEVFLEGGDESLEQLVLRFARGRGPFTTAEANARFGRDVEPLLHQLERREQLVRGELRPGGREREWCDPDVLRRLRRASLAALRKEVEPTEQAALGRFLPNWHGIDRRATPREALVPLQGLSLPVSLWEAEVLPRRAGRRYQSPRPQRRRPRRFSRQRSAGITATQGRWSPTDRLFPGRPDPRALAELLLERQGIVTRDGVRGEGIPGGYGAVYGQLRALETLGVCRRGYFVEGLGGAQFALPGAVERLRELRPQEDEEPEPLVLAAADPAQPYGASLAWPKRAGARAARVAGAQVVLLGG